MTNYSELMEKRLEEMRKNAFVVQMYESVLETMYNYRQGLETRKTDENGNYEMTENGSYIYLGRKSEDIDRWDALQWDAWNIAIVSLEKELSKLVK